MKEIRLSQIRRGLFCELDSTNGTAENYQRKSFVKISFKTFYPSQLVAYLLGTGEVPGSNLGKGKNFPMKIIGSAHKSERQV